MKKALWLAFQVTVALIDLMAAVAVGSCFGLAIWNMVAYMGHFGGTR